MKSINKTFLKITIPGYLIFRKDQSSGRGGRLALIVSDDIPFNTFELNINKKKGNVNISYEYRNYPNLVRTWFQIISGSKVRTSLEA